MSESLVNYVAGRLQLNQRVLFIWSGTNVPENLQSTMERLQEKVGKENRIHTEHFERLAMANYSPSTFDCILSDLLTQNLDLNSANLANYLNLLKPNGFLIASGSSNLESELKLNGFKEVNKETFGSVSLCYAVKPNFEVGSASKLKFSKKTTTTTTEQKPIEGVKVWKFTQDDIQEDDLIDTDALLEEADLKKPTNLDKFDCGTSSSGKKKACKNCTCGLAEEIEAEASNKQKTNAQTVKSSCGSCYLGDAFRCSSCPYLGLPPFKPGEKIQLTENLLKPDV